jgi:hypothetical protein
VKFKELKDRLRYEIVENNMQGTVQDFCHVVRCNNESEVASVLLVLEDEGTVELVETRPCFREDGGQIVRGVFGPSSKTLADTIVKRIAPDDEQIMKFNLDKEELERVYPLLRKRISREVRDARKIHTSKKCVRPQR